MCSDSRTGLFPDLCLFTILKRLDDSQLLALQEGKRTRCLHWQRNKMSTFAKNFTSCNLCYSHKQTRNTVPRFQLRKPFLSHIHTPQTIRSQIQLQIQRRDHTELHPDHPFLGCGQTCICLDYKTKPLIGRTPPAWSKMSWFQLG